MSERSPAPASGRNRYADLLRVAAIGGVIYGHWLLVSVTYANGQLSGVDALDYVEWGRWVTWLFQVMPVFFLVGGYVNAQSWMAHHARGETWTQWVRDRVLRLLWPTAVYLVVGELAVLVARVAGVPVGEVAEAGWLSAIQLWFLPAYMALIALTPVLLAAHHRWGLAVPAAMALAAALVDVTGRGDPRLHAIGYLNYVFVWGCIHQWGFAWRDRTLTSPWWRVYVLTAGGAALLAGLLASRAFNVDMVGSGNTNPPSIALLAFAAVQSGMVLAAEPQASGLLSGERRWRWIQRLNARVMNAYLWHFVPVIVIVVAFYPTGVLPQPAIGSAQWWELRLAWWALLTVVLVPLVLGVTLAERPMLRLPEGLGRPGPWSPVLLLAGIVCAGVGLSKLAIGGFLAGGGVPDLALALCALGLAAVLFTGRARDWDTGREPVPPVTAALPGRHYPGIHDGPCTRLPEQADVRVGQVRDSPWVPLAPETVLRALASAVGEDDASAYLTVHLTGGHVLGGGLVTVGADRGSDVAVLADPETGRLGYALLSSVVAVEVRDPELFRDVLSGGRLPLPRAGEPVTRLALRRIAPTEEFPVDVDWAGLDDSDVMIGSLASLLRGLRDAVTQVRADDMGQRAWTAIRTLRVEHRAGSRLTVLPVTDGLAVQADLTAAGFEVPVEVA